MRQSVTIPNFHATALFFYKLLRFILVSFSSRDEKLTISVIPNLIGNPDSKTLDPRSPIAVEDKFRGDDNRYCHFLFPSIISCAMLPGTDS